MLDGRCSPIKSDHAGAEQQLEPAEPVAYGHTVDDSHARHPPAARARRCPVAGSHPTFTVFALPGRDLESKSGSRELGERRVTGAYRKSSCSCCGGEEHRAGHGEPMGWLGSPLDHR
jgi:hypothetical protein